MIARRDCPLVRPIPGHQDQTSRYPEHYSVPAAKALVGTLGLVPPLVAGPQPASWQHLELVAVEVPLAVAAAEAALVGPLAAALGEPLAAEVAFHTVKQFLDEEPFIEKVTFVCFDVENYQLYQGLLD